MCNNIYSTNDNPFKLWLLVLFILFTSCENHTYREFINFRFANSSDYIIDTIIRIEYGEFVPTGTILLEDLSSNDTSDYIPLENVSTYFSLLVKSDWSSYRGTFTFGLSEPGNPYILDEGNYLVTISDLDISNYSIDFDIQLE